jgi:ribonuclease BN (tRNA processing enzyme)
MVVKVVGCHGGTSPGYRTTCFRINNSFLIDAGSAASSFSLKEQGEIKDVLITHPHIDHIKDLCFLVENSFRPEREPLVIHSTTAILDDIHNHLFNNVLWPDFSEIYVDEKSQKTLLEFRTIKPDHTVDNVKVKHFRVNHPGNAIGFILDDGQQQVLFSGDTGPTDLIWQAANECPNLVAIFTEISFPNRMEKLALASGHYTTQQMLNDIEKVNNKEVPVYISHFKPMFFEELMEEFHRLKPERVSLLHQEDEYFFS